MAFQMHSCVMEDVEDLLPGVQALLSPKIMTSLVPAKVSKVILVYKSNNLFVKMNNLFTKLVVKNVYATSSVFHPSMPKKAEKKKDIKPVVKLPSLRVQPVVKI